MHAYMQLQTYTHTHTCIHIHTHMHTDTYTHTHMHTKHNTPLQTYTLVGIHTILTRTYVSCVATYI